MEVSTCVHCHRPVIKPGDEWLHADWQRDCLDVWLAERTGTYATPPPPPPKTQAQKLAAWERRRRS
jgi:hypothetical protein